MSSSCANHKSHLLNRIESLTIQLVKVFDGERAPAKSGIGTLPSDRASSSEQSDSKRSLNEPIDISIPPTKEVATETVGSTEHECLSHIRQERDGLKAQCLEMEQCINRMQDELRELEKVKHINGSLESQLENKAWQVTNLQASKQSLEKQLKQSSQENQLLKSQLADLSVQCDESRRNAEEAQAMTEQSNAKLADLQHLCDAQQEALNHNKTQLEAKAASEQQLRRDIEEKSHMVLFARLRAQEEALHQSREANRSLESETNRMTQAMEKQETAKQSLQQTTQKLRQENQMLQSQLQEARSVADEMGNRFTALSTKFEAQTRPLNQSEESIILQETQIKDKDSVSADIESGPQNFEKDLTKEKGRSSCIPS